MNKLYFNAGNNVTENVSRLNNMIHEYAASFFLFCFYLINTGGNVTEKEWVEQCDSFFFFFLLYLFCCYLIWVVMI